MATREEIAKLYQTYLGRDPESESLYSRRSPQTSKQIIQDILDSPEYLEKQVKGEI